MNRKDSKIIYNMLPEVINKMSLKHEHSQFKQFINDIQQYFDKDKNVENIIEKLLRRLKEEISLDEIVNISYTI